jgi:hypothetical protein
MLKPAEIGRFLIEARETWGLARDDLGGLAGLDAAVIELAETGAADASDVAEIAAALGGTLDDVLAGRRFWTAPAAAFKNAPLGVDRSSVRAALLRVAAAARSLDVLREILGLPNVWSERGAALSPVAVTGDVTAQAEALAGEVRRQLDNVLEPISSVRDTMAHFGIATFLSDFGTDRVDGMTWRATHGSPSAAANVAARGGKRTAIRMTFAHELCHALFDGSRLEPMGVLESRGTERGDLLEQRANAFAAYFLAPRRAVADFLRDRGLGQGDKPTAQDLVASSRHFGMGVEAMGWHLVNCGAWARDDVHTHQRLATQEFPGDDDAENHPLPEASIVPLERRGQVLDLAALALSRDQITVARFREIVGLGLGSPWQRLLESLDVTV